MSPTKYPQQMISEQNVPVQNVSNKTSPTKYPQLMVPEQQRAIAATITSWTRTNKRSIDGNSYQCTLENIRNKTKLLYRDMFRHYSISKNHNRCD
uniref:Uncharacterized protein n=1 Tax=Romanomermis culicivorax TaxID=13658 RepID=A0A915KJQ5_ROMCU